MYEKLEDLVTDAMNVKLMSNNEDASIKLIMNYSEDEAIIDTLKSIVLVNECEQIRTYSTSL